MNPLSHDTFRSLILLSPLKNAVSVATLDAFVSRGLSTRRYSVAADDLSNSSLKWDIIDADNCQEHTNHNDSHQKCHT